jgi:hypothetical protein
VSSLLRRLLRLWGQSRIRLERPSLRPERIEAGSRLQIGSVVWRVLGRLPLPSGGWMFRLEAVGEMPEERRTARLVAGGVWLLVLDGEERILPPECVVPYSGF